MSLIQKISLWLPSKLYQSVVWMRNRLFDNNLIKSTSFYSAFVLSVGNITVGGTGKTPHVEYLIRLLGDKYKVAVLSRGYRRQTKGYLLANELPNVTAKEIGDEPYQIFSKTQDVLVAVDEDRVDGINHLLEQTLPPQVILLDDAFQHRYVKPQLSVVLCDYNRPPYADSLLPMGRLREPLSGLNRTDAVVVTKCPKHLTTEQLETWHQKLHLKPNQRIFSSVVSYDNLQGLHEEKTIDQLKTENSKFVLVTGIANPKPLCDYLSENRVEATHLAYADHHNFTPEDIKAIEQACGNEAILLTTEKDYVRLKTSISPELLSRTYFLPIRVSLSEGFDEMILSQLLR